MHVSPLFDEEHIVAGDFRKAEKCPFCDANNRLRFMITVVDKETTIFKERCSVLEFAPIKGFRAYLEKCNPNVDYLSGDINPRVAMRKLDITAIDLPNQSYDYVLCSHVMEHIINEATAIHEMMRIPKPDGTLVLTMPICVSRKTTVDGTANQSAEERLRLYGQKDHVRLYALDTAERLRGYGLNVNEVVNDQNWAEEHKKYKFIPGDRIFLCKLSSEI